ncbi:site-2 protease family protein [Bradyrhizobium sp. SYSU BS000235]|uniref:site-2 protease family protein n=1 Tax=Bradyrhizobium sp. SYSU BS000235 TaxID=3411332 RepID=UPI003C7855AD
MRFPTLSFSDGTIEIGRFGKAPVVLHPTFFLAAFVLTFHFWHLPGGIGPLLVICGAGVLLGSILLHELAHAKVGRHYGVTARRIDINLFGGVVHFATSPRLMRHDFAITIAGPLSNAALALLALLVLAVVRYISPEQFSFNPADVLVPPTSIVHIARFACFLNAALAIANMLPAFPLDGGRLLYMLVAKRYGAHTATFVVAALGTVFGAIAKFVLLVSTMAGVPIWSPPPFMINWDALQQARGGRAIRI